MNPIAKLVLLLTASSALLLVAVLLVALGETDAAIVVAAVTMVAFLIGLTDSMRSLPYPKLLSVAEYRRHTRLTIVGIVLHLVVAAGNWALLGPAAGALLALLGVAQAIVAAGWINSMRMLRAVPELLRPDEEPRAIALGANAMPGPGQKLVVATDDRIVWAEGRGLHTRHEISLRDVKGFEADRKSGTLVVVSARGNLRVEPVAKAELQTFERLLAERAAAAR